MNESEIRKYAGLMRELGLTGLEVHQDDRFIRLERSPGLPSMPTPVPQAAEPVAAQDKTEDSHVIPSPMVGVFYIAPTENADPFVQVGDKVKKGDVLCIVEAMKLMNEILADQDGEIVEICAHNGQVVDYGCPLFRIRR